MHQASYSSADGKAWAGAHCNTPGGRCTDGRPCDLNKLGEPFCHPRHPDAPVGVSRTDTLILPDQQESVTLSASSYALGPRLRFAPHIAET